MSAFPNERPGPRRVPEPHDDRSLGELFGELVTEARTLVRQEVDLAKTEMTQKATVAAKSGAKVAAGGVVALIGSLPLVAALVIGLGHLIGYGWAALIVGAVITGIGAFMAMNGIKTMKATSLAPVETKAQLQETKQWLQDQKR
jgi:hypothetical protein